MESKVPTVALLESYLPTIMKLQDYLIRLNNEVSCPVLQKEGDPLPYRNLIETAYVVTDFSLPLDKGIPLEPVSELTSMEPPTIRDVIRKSQRHLLHLKAPNLLTLGYKLTQCGVTNVFVNTLVTALQGSEWSLLLKRIGMQAMLHLLTRTSLFLSLPNGCLCQMTGQPIYAIKSSTSGKIAKSPDSISNATRATSCKRKGICCPNDERPAKRLKIHPSRNQQSFREAEITKRSPAEVLLIRQRFLYSRPIFFKGTNQITVGLPPNHILNCLESPFPNVPGTSHGQVDPNSRIQEKNARHLAKYIFSRQYGIPSAFMFFKFSEREAYKIPDFVNREDDIKKLAKVTDKKTRTPKRLHQVLPMLEKLIWRHSKCKYRLLRDRTCPSKIKGREMSNEVILEMVSENKLLSQLSRGDTSLDTAGNSISVMGLTQAEREAKRKPQFSEFCCTYEEVYRFVVQVVQSVIPKAFWGNKDNFEQICQHIKTFVTARRYDKVSLHLVLQGFSTAACDWLLPPGNGTKQQSVPVTDSLKRRELLEDFLFWVFDSFIVSLIRTTFYVTESSAFRNRILYFRHDDWNTLSAPLLKDLKEEKFEKISEVEAQALLQQRKLGFSFVRLLPKDLGVRPIVNLRRKQASLLYGEQSINRLLQAALRILNYEKDTQPDRLGAACLGTDDHYTKLKEYKLRLPRNPDGSLPKLYFVKVDVQACFDTIDQTKLLEILRDLISEDSYAIQRYTQISPALSSSKTMYRKQAWPDAMHPHFVKYATDLANALRHTIFVDQVSCQVESRDELLDLLEQHIKENIVKIGNSYYRQKVGIPQGSSLSTILCAFFYGDMEKQFGAFAGDSQSVLLRNVDDYLFITTRPDKAAGFVRMMYKGHPDYGCFISKGKTLTNFHYDEEIMNVTGPKDRSFPWCGYLIDMRDLSICVDYTRYYNGYLRDSVTVDRGCKAGREFRRKMLVLAKTRGHAIFNDPQLNSEDAVFTNVYQNFFLTAMKMHCFLRHWDIKAKKNKGFIYETIKQMLSYCFVSIRNKTLNKVAKENGASVALEKPDVVWLGMHAFHTVLSRKPTQYSALVRLLAFQLGLPKNKRRGRRFARLVKEGSATFSSIVE
ncbi:Telomerase reverse transcriptase [Marasmius tenuissimus]|nr:Telomerase reverse transcriptase [Marasmius tenuissimus]